MSATPAAQQTTAATPYDTNGELSLKQAALVVGKNERTLRRKLDDGSLKGRKKPLETGGELWLVDYQSLMDTFGGDAAATPAAQQTTAATPYDLPDLDLFSLSDGASNSEPPPPTIVQRQAVNQPSPSAAAPAAVISTPVVAPAATPAAQNVMASGGAIGQHPEEKPPVPALTDFLLKEHESLKSGFKQDLATVHTRHREEVSSLKEQLEQREGRITTLQEQNGQLRQELGEVRGRAETEAKMVQWLQGQLEQVRHQLTARVYTTLVEQENAAAAKANPEPTEHIINIETSAPATSTRTRSSSTFPVGAAAGLIAFLVISGVALAYFTGLLGGR